MNNPTEHNDANDRFLNQAFLDHGLEKPRIDFTQGVMDAIARENAPAFTYQLPYHKGIVIGIPVLLIGVLITLLFTGDWSTVSVVGEYFNTVNWPQWAVNSNFTIITLSTIAALWFFVLVDRVLQRI